MYREFRTGKSATAIQHSRLPYQPRYFKFFSEPIRMWRHALIMISIMRGGLNALLALGYS